MPVHQIVQTALANRWALEFSSGMPFQENMCELYINAPVKRLAHNYFPAPASPFVLNLASNNTGIRTRSIEHCKNGLRLSGRSGSPFFAAHAGFCIDPQPAELGNKINFDSGFDRELHWALFIASVTEVLRVAEEIGIDFLIENNVLGGFNLQNGVNPLFCCECEDIVRLFNEIKHNRLGLLLDTAHLKVSCHTLTLNLEQQYNCIRTFIRAVHHSDNDGLKDSNQLLTDDYWFLPYVKEFCFLPQVIEVKNISNYIIKSQIELIEKACHEYNSETAK